MRQLAPDLLLHPILDEAEALTGVPNREVVHPSSQQRIDQVYHPFDRLRPVSAEHLFELSHQCRPLFELGRVMRPPRPPSTAEVAEVEAQKSEAFTSPRSTMRLFSSLISTCSLPNSSQSRLSTAPTSQSVRAGGGAATPPSAGCAARDAAISIKLRAGIGSSKAEQGPLIVPSQRQARLYQQLVCGQPARLAPLENGARDVRGEIAEADKPREIGWADAFLLGQCGKRYAVAAGEGGIEAARSDQQLDQPPVGLLCGKRIAPDEHPDLPPAAAQLYQDRQGLGFAAGRVRR